MKFGPYRLTPFTDNRTHVNDLNKELERVASDMASIQSTPFDPSSIDARLNKLEELSGGFPAGGGTGTSGGGGGGGGGGGAPTDLTYVTEANESGSLPDSRQLAAGTNITLTDAGPGSTLTVAALASGLFLNGTNTSVTPYAVATTDVVVCGSATAGADQIVNLPAALGDWRLLAVVKMDFLGHNVVVTAAGGDLINGFGTFTLTIQYAVVLMTSNLAGAWTILGVIVP